MWRRNYASVNMGIREVDTINCRDKVMRRRNYASVDMGIKKVDTMNR